MTDTPNPSDGGGPDNPGTPPEATPPATDWHSGYDEDTRGWLNAKGFDRLDSGEALANVIKTARNSEKLHGLPTDRVLTLPVDPKAEGAFDPIYKALGRPDAATDYTFDSAEEDDTQVVEWAGGLAHKLGLNPSQANAMYDSLAEFVNGIVDQEKKDAETLNQAADQDLKNELGARYPILEAQAKLFVEKTGATPEIVQKLEDALGYADVMKYFMNLSAKIGEDNFEDGDGGGNDQRMTPEGARQEINDLKKDPAFVKKYMEGDVDANRRMDNLHKLAYPPKAS
jgi:hypothetical protein